MPIIMKHLLTCAVAAFLAVLMAAMIPMQAFAETEPEKKYISEIRLGVGKNADEAAASLEGYEILKDENGNNVDLNRNAGTTKFGGKGNRVVYLGYLLTSNEYDAVTDLAVMNMQGGYSIEDYKDLMEAQMSSQIIPFVESFVTAIGEYRVNYQSDIPANRTRAMKIHDALNLLLDDDCGDKGLGDLLLNPTKYEMGDADYNALSESEKKNHADILTILQQAHGNAVLIMENLIARACDMKEDTWIDRFADTTYDDLLYEEGLGFGVRGKKMLDLKYYDDAMKIVDMWEPFRTILNSFDESAVALNEMLEAEIPDSGIDYANTDFGEATDREIEAFANDLVTLTDAVDRGATAYENVMVGPYLSSIDYGDGTLLDFFMKPVDEIRADVTVLYPLVASLSKGQKTALECITLEDLIIFAATEEKGYEKFDAGIDEPFSIYFGVDRGIYEFDNVAVTTDARRDGKTGLDGNNSGNAEFALSMWSKIMCGVTAASVVAFGASLTYYLKSPKVIAQLESQLAVMESNLKALINPYKSPLAELCTKLYKADERVTDLRNKISYTKWDLSQAERGVKLKSWLISEEEIAQLNAAQKAKAVQIRGQLTKLKSELKTAELRMAAYDYATDMVKAEESAQKAAIASKKSQIATRSRMSKGLMAGSTILTIAIAGFTAYMIYKDYKAMADRYKVTFTVIPRYMIDSKDLVSYNENGDRIVLKNQEAYYKAALCNRKSGDEYYETVGNVGDLNGDVGKQWLALYYEKNENKQPILASSLYFTGNTQIPAGYQYGIHMFGSEASLNLNAIQYCWNSSAPDVYVYYQLDTSVKQGGTTSGSIFSSGTAAVFGIAGLVIGSLGTALIMVLLRKKKEKQAAV